MTHFKAQKRLRKMKKITSDKTNEYATKEISIGLLVGPPMLMTSKGLGRGANSLCHVRAAARSVAEST